MSHESLPNGLTGTNGVSTEKSNFTAQLIQSSFALEGSLKTLQDINQKSHFIALSASIEGARMKSRLATFSIVANQIAVQATKNSELSTRVEKVIEKIQSQALAAVSVRNLELAIDLIDKLDRNLFERNCDVQAWATFDAIRAALQSPSEENSREASRVLENLVKTYVVYKNSLLISPTGEIIASAQPVAHTGYAFPRQTWFNEVLKGEVVVTDVEQWDVVGGYVVRYCAPVLNEEKQVLGVLCNSFNWDYALEMIRSGGFEADTDVSIINSLGTVIGSKNINLLSQDHLNWLDAGRLATGKSMGYGVEHSRNGEPIAVGFAHTRGYNAYKGKGWSAVLAEKVRDAKIKNQIFVARPTQQLKPEESKIDSEISSANLLETMKEIDRLVLEINTNNREVKLLAINASIQAGLAGAEGEGFSIIANEVALLAKKSLAFVQSVNEITVQLREAVAQSSSVRLQDAAFDTMSKVDRNLFERFCDIQAWSTFPKLIESLENQLSADPATLELLAKIHKIYEVYHDIYLLDLNGRVLATAIQHHLIGQSFAQKEWQITAASGAVYVGDLVHSETLKMPLMTFSSPVLNAAGAPIGVLASRFNCAFLNDIIKATVIDSRSRAFLLNAQGAVIASSEPSEVLNKAFKELKSVQQRTGPRHGFNEEEKQIYGFSRSTGYNTYQGKDWQVITVRDKSSQAMGKVLTPAEEFQRLLENRAASRKKGVA